MTRKISLALLAGAALLVSTSSRAELADVSIGEDAVRLDLQGSLGRWFDMNNGDYDLGVVWGDVDDFDSQHFVAAHGGLMISGDAGAPNVKAGVGGRLEYVHTKHDDGEALALGGQFRITPPDFNRLGFNGWAWWAPNASSFSDLDGYFEFGASVGYEVLKDAEVYVGYRKIQVNPDGPGGHVDLEDSADIGVRLRF